MSECPICGREREDQFCVYHQTAFNNLKENYEKWKTSAGLEWDTYLEKIASLEETGRWVVEVIEFITQQDGL